ncbi:globin domain-containing protein [Chelativorans sp. M5D2P16]|uniref:globin domain-containing protein n=1 Tax=Chelativorans sp. M5D2P16 TaxID=3095678 RepID=UPI002ACAEEFD|nr:globin domain-containing protein [Chelativorans sp. M5D2P16]MDZ5698733.1 globin domain-containing protein [Chelativorans sp. M5D2P16]
MLRSGWYIACQGLKQRDAVLPAVESLARQHVGYGVRDMHYDTVDQALIETLEEGLGDAFTPEAREAWLAAYALLSQIMVTVSRQPASPETSLAR